MEKEITFIIIIVLSSLIFPNAVSAVSITLNPHQIEPGDTIYITTTGLTDGSDVTMNWEVLVDELPGSNFTWEVRNLTFPINLDNADFRITNQNTVNNKVTLQNDVPDYGSRELIKSGQSINGVWSASHGADFINGSWPVIRDEGTVVRGKNSVLSLVEWHGIKRATHFVPSQIDGGPDDFTIPLSMSGFSNGRVKVSIYVNNSLALSDTVTIGDPDTRSGILYITTIPPGASINIDGIYYGMTPSMVRNVAPGIRKVLLTKTGYAPFERSVLVSPARITLLTGIALQNLSGTIIVTSIPKGADVYLDGELSGITPLTISGVVPGTYELEVKKTGYKEFHKTITVTDGKTVRVGPVVLIRERQSGTANAGDRLSRNSDTTMVDKTSLQEINSRFRGDRPIWYEIPAHT